jgi:hypothetical protein
MSGEKGFTAEAQREPQRVEDHSILCGVSAVKGFCLTFK